MPLKLIQPGKRKNNKFYLILGMENGRQYEVSTRTTDKRRAKELLDRLKRQLEGAPLAGSRITFSQAIDLYAAYRPPSVQDWRLLEKLRWVLGRKLVADIRQADLVQAANRLYGNRTAATRNRNVLIPAGA